MEVSFEPNAQRPDSIYSRRNRPRTDGKHIFVSHYTQTAGLILYHQHVLFSVRRHRGGSVAHQPTRNEAPRSTKGYAAEGNPLSTAQANAAIHTGARLNKRPLPNLSIVRQPRHASASITPTTDIDGYQMPPRAPHTTIIKVSSKTPFMAIIKRTRHALDNGPQRTKGLPLTARIAALGVAAGRSVESQGVITDALDDVVLVATGKAIQRAFEAAFFLRRNKELTVVFRTRTVSAIDDIVMDDDEADEEDQVRVRHVSCVEIGVRWK